jgi:hypothetical protein
MIPRTMSAKPAAPAEAAFTMAVGRRRRSRGAERDAGLPLAERR